MAMNIGRIARWFERAAARAAASRLIFLPESPGYGTEPYERSIRLLKANLSPAQRCQFEEHTYFDLKGGNTGKSYRIRHGRVANIEEHNVNGICVRKWCFAPVGQLPIGDVMLAQKLALEVFEQDTLRLANRLW